MTTRLPLSTLFFRHAKSSIVEVHVLHLKHNKEKFLNFALFLDRRIQQTKIVSHTNMSLFSSTIDYLEHDTRNISKTWLAKTEIRKKSFLLNVECHFSPAENSFSN